MAEVINGEQLFSSLNKNIAPDLKSEEDYELILKKYNAFKKLPSYRGDVMTKNNIRNLSNVEKGEIFWVSTERAGYIVSDRDGKKITLMKLDENATFSTGITIYDMNKAIIEKEPLFDWDNLEAVNNLYDELEKFFTINTSASNYLCYGRMMHYVSLFSLQDRSLFNEESIDKLIQTIQCVGKIISFDFHEDNGDNSSIEIWIRTNDSKAELLYLFPYDNGIINLTKEE